mmetsp:Transcript_27707/g.67443  ORF Transcript_27707/g.67443 Transcript_27707/m.67443 type:complete len:601 (+) Transcript_27707:158-1960(+)|eukprot:CAMPEP_0113624266 /NCGR_PEP_ID=MMETSP0017_2-20120614/12504_1 /TAXON_ID=2856 /ORGANISM="Cylindrotheca closterium" /LENGTH=600 /DNA_ID=CAMNT_0000534281 /DNA_START=111 /DNA_END=1913 /DNA_ORIENTATION=- /assembly_acc=CAM_ASM_000147
MLTRTNWTTAVVQLLSILGAAAAIECDLYMAESTIPNAGLGIFSATERNPGDSVGYGDICIPILDLNNYHKKVWNPFNDYVWAGEVMGMKLEIESGDKEALCPGLDCAINCNLALINVAKANPIYDDGRLHRYLHPGAGAITPYHNGTTRVTRTIPQGGELFKFYGDAWFTTRRVFDSLPLSHDYPWAQHLLNTFFERVQHKDKAFKSTAYDELLVSIRSIWNSRTLNALPATFDEAIVAFEHDIGMVYQPNATRSIKWLENNGKCVDHIKPGQSTIEGAGHGAFATRDLPKGTIITGSPLHHLPVKEEFMPMFRAFHNEEDVDEKLKSEVAGQQVLLNYCFGHPQSTLLLCPYGAGVGYINHNQTRANVKVVWSKDGQTSHDATWLKKQPNEMLSTQSARLALDYVATRDIASGEELFLDYGDAWEEAWNKHIESWKQESSSENYLGAREWNNVMASSPIRTFKEVFYDPYPRNVHLRCHVDIIEDEWEPASELDWGAGEYGYECEVTERKKDVDGNHIYSVRVLTEEIDRWDTEFEGPELLDIDNVPRDAIRFFDVPFTSDLFLEGTFRHFIGLPDHLVPNVWKNRPKEAKNPQNSEL